MVGRFGVEAIVGGRTVFPINVSTVDNRRESFARSGNLAARDFSPIQPLADDCLLAFRGAP